MKQLKCVKSTAALICVIGLLLCFVSCDFDSAALWKNATYAADASVGTGAKQVEVDVVTPSKTVVLTLNTDEETLGAALYAEGLINDPLFFDTLNGIRADWSANSAYWSFYIGEELQSHGVGEEFIFGGEHYRIVYTR